MKKLIFLYKAVENIWFKVPEKLRFLLVGGFNALTAFLIYNLFLYVLNGREQISLLLMTIINTNISIITMRYYVFRSKNRFLTDYQKALFAYGVLYLVNVGLLAGLVRIVKLKEHLSESNILYEVPNLDKAAAQLVCVVIITILTFLTHKYFSFRKNKK